MGQNPGKIAGSAPASAVDLPAGPIKRIHVHQAVLRQNVKDGGDRPVLTVKCRGFTYTAHEVVLDGPSRVPTDAHPLACGARVWIESTAAVTLHSRAAALPVPFLPAVHGGVS